jgi:uncharacterized protein YwqG
MSLVLFAILVLAFAVVVMYFRRRHLFTDVKDAWNDVVAEAKADIAAQRAARDAPPPMTDEEADALVDWYRAEVRPAFLLRPDPGSDALQAAARIGGPAWLAGGESWPLDAEGKRLEFVAQYDLSRLPPLTGFPRQGVARFFVGRSDIFGVDFDAPDRSDIKILWHNGPQVGGRLEPPQELNPYDMSPFQSISIRADGIALRAEPALDRPDYYSWQLQEQIDRFAGRAGLDAVEDELMQIAEEREYAHRIGGHPSFTQYDFRKRGEMDDLDILLLGLSSDDAIMWGDVGEAGFYIRRGDFDARDFSRVAFNWDCH